MTPGPFYYRAPPSDRFIRAFSFIYINAETPVSEKLIVFNSIFY
jgi:hypothetical protein